MNITALLQTAWKRRNVVILAVLTAAMTANAVQSLETIRSFTAGNKIRRRGFIGDQFLPIRHLLNNAARVGYYTDRSLDEKAAAAQFAQAQYTLAPTILELNALDHPFVIFDYKNKNNSLSKIRELGLVALSMSSSGIVVAKNPGIK